MTTGETALSEEGNRIDSAVRFFESNRASFDVLVESLRACLSEDDELQNMIHFIKHRVKAAESLRAKLRRLAGKDDGKTIDESNLFRRITDLAGLRIIHLHTDQIARMHPRILKILEANRYRVIGRPVAYCWDVEYEKLFQDVGLRTEQADSMYTSVHYDVQTSVEKPITCELQVRSLVDEVWGEVSHRVNYPAESSSEACRDQLKVLARLTSGCGRLVDSIFKTHGNVMAAERP